MNMQLHGYSTRCNEIIQHLWSPVGLSLFAFQVSWVFVAAWHHGSHNVALTDLCCKNNHVFSISGKMDLRIHHFLLLCIR